MLKFVRFAICSGALSAFAMGGAVAQTESVVAPRPFATKAQVAALKAKEIAAKRKVSDLAKGLAVVREGGVTTVQLKNGSTRPATEEESAASDVYANALTARKAAERAELMSIVTTEEWAEVDAANGAIRASLQPRTRFVPTDAGPRIVMPDGTTRPPEGAEVAAIAKRDAVVERLNKKVENEAIARAAPLRIVADPSLAGKAGSGDGNVIVLSQTLVFNRAAKLTEDLVANRGKSNVYTLPAGSILFVVNDPEDEPAFCLPHKGTPGFFFGVGPWIPCFFDRDGDGALEVQTDGGTPLNGVYMYASGFEQKGAVTQPARTEPIPYLEGYAQRAELWIKHLGFNKKKQAHEVAATIWVGPADGQRTPVSGSEVLAELKVGETKLVEASGAKIELQVVDKQTLTYKVVEPMPEQPFGLETTRGRY